MNYGSAMGHSDDPTQLKNDAKSEAPATEKKKEEPESSNSNKSVSLAGVPVHYVRLEGGKGLK